MSPTHKCVAEKDIPIETSKKPVGAKNLSPHTDQPSLARDYKAICFDLDNTLFDRQATMQRVYQVLLSESSAPLDEQESALIRIMKRDQRGYTDRHEFCKWLHQTLRWPEISTPEALWHKILQRIPDMIFPHHAEAAMLQRLQPHFRLGLLSNGSSRNQRNKLQASQLEAAFAPEYIWISEEIGHAKPSFQAFARVQEGFALDAKEILFVGDHPQEDIEGAIQAGMSTCWVSLARSPSLLCTKPTLQLAHILSLPELLQC